MQHIKQMYYFLFVLLLTTPQLVFATGFRSPLQSNLDSIPAFIEAALKLMVYVATPVAVLFIIYSGFMFVLAQGNPESLKKAKLNFLWTIIGVTVLLGSWALSVMIKGTIDPILQM